MKVATLAAFVLTLATWMLFHAFGSKFGPEVDLAGMSTVVVFGVWFLIALAIHWLWRRATEKGHSPRKET